MKTKIICDKCHSEYIFKDSEEYWLEWADEIHSHYCPECSINNWFFIEFKNKSLFIKYWEVWNKDSKILDFKFIYESSKQNIKEAIKDSKKFWDEFDCKDYSELQEKILKTDSTPDFIVWYIMWLSEILRKIDLIFNK